MEYAIFHEPAGPIVEERVYGRALRAAEIKHIDGVPMARPIRRVVPAFDPATHRIAGWSDLIDETAVTRMATIEPIPPPPPPVVLTPGQLADGLLADRALRAAILALNARLPAPYTAAELRQAIVDRIA